MTLTLSNATIHEVFSKFGLGYKLRASFERGLTMASGIGMILGAGVGILFAPAIGPFGIVLGAAMGLLAGAAVARFK